MKNMNYYVYILTNKSNERLYVGVTSDLVKRTYGHKQKFVDGFAEKYNITKLVYFETTSNIDSAIAREKQIKKYRADKKKYLITKNNPEWKDLYFDII